MPWTPKDCIVVPVDFSDSAALAVNEALAMAAGPQNVHVIHVIPQIDAISPGAIFGNQTEDKLIATCKEHLETFLASREINGVTAHVIIGDPGMKVVEYAAEHKADLIVVPSHGYHGLKHLLLGSVAERIIRHAACPVYVLRRVDAE